MRKILLALVVPMFFLTSCYNVRVAVGDVYPDQPLVKVASETNNFFIGGLVPGGNNNLKAENYIGNKNSFVAKTNKSFVNGLLSAITFGVYTPTTTTFYIPADDYDYQEEIPQRVVRRTQNQQIRKYDSSIAFDEEYNSIEQVNKNESAPLVASRDYNFVNRENQNSIGNFDYIEEKEIVEQPFSEQYSVPQQPVENRAQQQIASRNYNNLDNQLIDESGRYNRHIPEEIIEESNTERYSTPQVIASSVNSYNEPIKRDYNSRGNSTDINLKNRYENAQTTESIEYPLNRQDIAPQEKARLEVNNQPVKRDYNQKNTNVNIDQRNRYNQTQAVQNQRNYSTNNYRDEQTKIENNVRPDYPTYSGGTYKAVVYFRNGAKMNGTVTEHPGNKISIQLPGGSVIDSNIKDIKQIERK